jgi:hypothetical protein
VRSLVQIQDGPPGTKSNEIEEMKSEPKIHNSGQKKSKLA